MFVTGLQVMVWGLWSCPVPSLQGIHFIPNEGRKSTEPPGSCRSLPQLRALFQPCSAQGSPVLPTLPVPAVATTGGAGSVCRGCHIILFQYISLQASCFLNSPPGPSGNHPEIEFSIFFNSIRSNFSPLCVQMIGTTPVYPCDRYLC